MATPQQLRETSRILTKHAKNVRHDADRARERFQKLREIADRAKLSGEARHAHAEAARHRQDER
jgi:hypothetical protein